MNIDYTLIVLGEPYSTFSEIIGKYFKNKKKFKNKVVLIGDADLLEKQINKLNLSFNLNKINNLKYSKRNVVNIINIKFKYRKVFSNITKESSDYIEQCFKKSLELAENNKKRVVLINGPISKETFLKKKYLGITEYLSNKTKSKNEVMLIYNKNLSVSPITTHIPIKYVSKKVTKKKIINNIYKNNIFFNKVLKKKVKFAILGLNPHCETTDKFSEENKIIKPAIQFLTKKGVNIDGPFSADTFFLKKNVKKYDVVVGMYHDQVLTPMKTLFKFEAINVTLGLPFIRISPDHGPNSKMLGKGISDPSSFFYAMNFINKLCK